MHEMSGSLDMKQLATTFTAAMHQYDEEKERRQVQQQAAAEQANAQKQLTQSMQR